MFAQWIDDITELASSITHRESKKGMWNLCKRPRITTNSQFETQMYELTDVFQIARRSINNTAAF